MLNNFTNTVCGTTCFVWGLRLRKLKFLSVVEMLLVSCLSVMATGVHAQSFQFGPNGTLIGCNCSGAITIPSTYGNVAVTTIGKSAFQHRHLTAVTIPNSVTEIGDNAFQNNNLTSVLISNNVTKIGKHAFQNNNLTSVTIPNNLSKIEDYAFSGNALISVTIPQSVTAIGVAAFSRNSLASITIPKSVSKIGEGAFILNFLDSVTIPSSVKTIEASAFSDNRLTSVVIPNTVKTIKSSAFSFNLLPSVTIPESVTEVGENAFYSNRLTSLTLPSSLKAIREYAFTHNRLISVSIPSTVTAIENNAFQYNNLESVTIPNSVTTIGGSAFFSNRLATLNIPRNVVSVGDFAFSYNHLQTVVFDGDRPTTLLDGAFKSNGLTTINYRPGKVGWPGEAIAGILPTGLALTAATGKTGGTDNVKIETPSPYRVMSGVVQLRGWYYDPNNNGDNIKLNIQIDSMPSIAIEVNQKRSDVTTSMGLASTPSIGWSSLYYTGILNNGPHTVRLKDEHDITLLEQTFTSFTPYSGRDTSNFISGVSRQLEFMGFPYSGSRILIEFDQAEQAFTIIDQFDSNNDSLSSNELHYTKDSFVPNEVGTINNIPRHKIETPSVGRVLSGVTSLRGWSLPATNLASENLTVQIDDQVTSIVPVREPRKDVLDSMNVGEKNTIGWSMLFYSGSLENGRHRVRLFSGEEPNKRLLAQTFFRSFTALGANGYSAYLGALPKTVMVDDFPFLGSQVELKFDTASQNFPVLKQLIKN